ncbi:unnamed protein product, partial [Rotaria sordida]
IPNISPDARWVEQGVTVAGGYNSGSADNQVYWPGSVSIDDDQTVVVTDYGNHRIMQWKKDGSHGDKVAGGNGKGTRSDQLHGPTDILIDKETDSLIISDRENRRVVRWFRRRDTTQGETLLDNIRCHGLALADQRFLYVADIENQAVKRYDIKRGDKEGTIVAGGNGKGNSFKQFDWPTHLFVDCQQTVYVSDYNNHRVMKWHKDATEGIVVAGGIGCGNSLTQLCYPRGLFVDTLGTIYVVERGNHRVTRWPQGEKKEGSVIVGGNGQGDKANQLSGPVGLSFDKHGHL